MRRPSPAAKSQGRAKILNQAKQSESDGQTTNFEGVSTVKTNTTRAVPLKGKKAKGVPKPF